MLVQVLSALRSKVEAKLERLEISTIITSITFSKWAAPIGPILKQEGKVRRPWWLKVHPEPGYQKWSIPLPRIEDLLASLSKGTLLTDPSLAIFQRTMDSLLQGLPAMCVYIDNLFITDEIEEEHLNNLDALLVKFQLYRRCSSRVNKCAFILLAVKHLYHHISSQVLYIPNGREGQGSKQQVYAY